MTFDLSDVEPLVVTAFVHYADSCVVAASNQTLTWDGRIDEYFRKSYDNYGVSTWPAAQIAASMPVVNVNYTARTAEVSVHVNASFPVPFVYARGDRNQLLGFGRPAVGGASLYTLRLAELPVYGTSVFGCAPLGGEAFCSEIRLLTTITNSLIAAHPVSAAPVVLPASLTSVYSVQVSPPSDATCTPSGGYVLWLRGVGTAADDIVGFSVDSPLTVSVGPAAASQCTYATAMCLLTAYVLCGAELRTGVVNVTALVPPAYTEGAGPSGNGTLDGHVGPPRCEDSHPGRDTSWIDEATGDRCECFQGAAECGVHRDFTLYLTPVYAAVIAAAGAVIGLVLLVLCCYLRLQHRKAMETPIEGGARRSLVLPKSNDYVRSRGAGGKRGSGEEVELPAPPQAGGVDSGGVTIMENSEMVARATAEGE